MQTILFIILVIVVIAMVILILLQQSKGAEMGASFGAGGSDTVFGALGSMSIFAKMTTVLAISFFVISLSLAYLARQQNNIGSNSNYDLGIESVEGTSEAADNSELGSGFSSESAPSADDLESELPEN